VCSCDPLRFSVVDDDGIHWTYSSCGVNALGAGSEIEAGIRHYESDVPYRIKGENLWGLGEAELMSGA
jgi:hypothetical protein